MITKTLKASGGDYSTLADVIVYIKARLSEGLSDNITIDIENGGVFGTATSLNDMTVPGPISYNSKNIVFKTEYPITAPARINGSWVITMDSGSEVYGTSFQDLILAYEGTVVSSCFRGLVDIDNCLIYLRLNNFNVQIFGFNINMRNCSIFISATSTEPDELTIENISFRSISNNLLCIYSSQDIMFDSLTSDLGLNRNNTFFNYGGGTLTDSLAGIWHTDFILNSDPKLVNNVIQSATDSLDTMISRSAALTELSTPCIGNAYPFTATTTDITGKSRF